MRGLWTRWVLACTRTEPGDALVVFRVLIGLVQLYAVLTVLLHGVLPALWLEVPDGGYREKLTPGHWFLWLGVSPATVWGTVAASLASGLALTLGLGGPVLGRLVALVALQTTMGLADLNSHAGGSYDQLMSNAHWLLVVFDSTRTGSVHCRRTTGAWRSDAPGLALGRWLVAVQLVLCYWSTGAQKVSLYWTPMGGYSALYYILQQPTWQRFDLSFAAWIYPLTQALSAGTWWWEWTSPLVLLAMHYRATPERPGRLRAWSNRWRLRDAFVAFGLSFHLGVMSLMEVGPFSPVTMAYYAALLAPDEWRRLAARAGAWRAREQG